MTCRFKFRSVLPFRGRPPCRIHAAANLVVFDMGFHYSNPAWQCNGQTHAGATVPVSRTSTFALSHFRTTPGSLRRRNSHFVRSRRAHPALNDPHLRLCGWPVTPLLRRPAHRRHVGSVRSEPAGIRPFVPEQCPTWCVSSCHNCCKHQRGFEVSAVVSLSHPWDRLT